MAQPRYTHEEIGLQGRKLYEQRIRALVEARFGGQFLVIDIDSGDYEVDFKEMSALERARTKHPEGIFYLMRIGASAAYRIGAAQPGRSA